MGKKGAIQILAKVIARIAIHKILLKKGNRPEAGKHLQDEIRDYSTDIFEFAISQTFSKSDLDAITHKALKRAKNFEEEYHDVEITDSDIREAVADTMQELMLI